MLSRLKTALRALLRRTQVERELDEELRYHIEQQIEQNIRLGMNPEEAPRAALKSFGGVEQAKERSRDARGVRRLEELWQDLRYGLRMLLKQPGFTLIAVITLALGVGANTAIFSVVNAVLLRPLPFKESERLVMVWNKGAEAAGGDRTPLAVADLLDWRAQNRSFESVGAFQKIRALNYTGGEEPEQARGAKVTANFFTLLGAPVQLGRDFLPADERLGAPPVTLLSDRFWRKHFGADPQVIGRTISLSGMQSVIIGVMPANLNFPDKDVELWTALQLGTPTQYGPWFLTGVGRLKLGVTLQQARADVQTMKSSFSGGKFDFNLLPINDYIVGDVRPALIALLIAVTLVLLIAAANVANLTLVRAAARVKEISIRTALGAHPWRIIRQLLTESLLLAVAGGALGALGAMWGIDLLRRFAPQDIPRLDQISIDARVLGWTTLVSLLTGVIFGLAPARQSSRLNLNEALKEGRRSATDGAGRRRWRSVLVIAELALAVMLLIGAGLLVKSLWRLQQVELGINPERALTLQLVLRGQRYNQPPQVLDFYSRLVEQTQSLPGVRAVAVSTSLPPDETDFSSDFTIEGRSVTPNHEPQIAYFIRVSPDYFRALGIPLRGGRYFTAADTGDSPRVMLVNETMRRRFFPGENPIGKRLNLGNAREPDWNQIVGVVGDVRYNGLADEVEPALYQPAAQAPASGMSLIVKTESADPLSLTAAVRNEVRKLDPELPIAQISTLDEHLATAVAQPRFRTTLIALFAIVALMLACIGIYGVMSYVVTQRTHEIGVRLALGARSSDILRLALGQGMSLALAGLSIGLPASLALTQLMKGLLYGVSATDPMTFGAAAALLMVAALLAALVPARRATKVDPLVAIRNE